MIYQYAGVRANRPFHQFITSSPSSIDHYFFVEDRYFYGDTDKWFVGFNSALIDMFFKIEVIDKNIVESLNKALHKELMD